MSQHRSASRLPIALPQAAALGPLLARMIRENRPSRDILTFIPRCRS